MNSISVIGNLGADPDVRTSESGNTWCRFRVAVRRRFKRDGSPDTDWFDVKAFGKTAELVDQYLRKGSQVGIVGQMVSDPYEDDDGNKRDGWAIVADQVSFVGKKDDAGSGKRRDRDEEDEPRRRGGEREERAGSSAGGRRSSSGEGGGKQHQASKRRDDEDEIPF